MKVNKKNNLLFVNIENDDILDTDTIILSVRGEKKVLFLTPDSRHAVTVQDLDDLIFEDTDPGVSRR